MRALIVFYSRTGHTRKVAEDICSMLYGSIEKIEDSKNREGIFGWFSAGRDAALEKQTSIEETANDASKFDIIIIGSPVWAGKISPAIRTYISRNKNSFKKVAFFCTSGGNNFKGAIKNMEIACGKSPLCVFHSTTHDVKQDNYLERLKEFCDAINSAPDSVHIFRHKSSKEDSKVKSKNKYKPERRRNSVIKTAKKAERKNKKNDKKRK